MPVSLYDGQVYEVEFENIDRKWMLSFFLHGHIEDCLALYGENGIYKGIVTYRSLLTSTNLESAIDCDRLLVGDTMWYEARIFLDGNRNKTVPVFNQDMEMIYLAKFEPDLVDKWEKLQELRDRGDWVDCGLLNKFTGGKKSFHIKGINDVLFALRKWLISLSMKVNVSGEEWRLFGIKEECTDDTDEIIIDKECQWLDKLYSEYMDWLSGYKLELEKRLFKPYIREYTTEKILFFLPNKAYFVDSIAPLVFKYIHERKECIIVFSSVLDIVKSGKNNILQVLKLIDRFEAGGAKCYSIHASELYDNEYEICFVCSEYSGDFPYKFRQASRLVVSLQTSALYTHAYYDIGRFSVAFSEQEEMQVDYLVVSDYTADWICKRYDNWEKKLLRFGYPKLDTLYHAMRDDIDIPEEWKKMTAGKKVFLFMTSAVKKSWLEMFAYNNKNVLIWRPHPLILANAKWQCDTEKIRENYNIIIDDMVSYYAAFRLSDAAIADPVSSATVNYLYTGKPICIVDAKEQQRAVKIDYRQDLWYKSAWIATEDDAVLEFVKMVKEGDNLITEEQKDYYRCIQNNFDGQVCKRIYDYFDKKVNRKK